MVPIGAPRMDFSLAFFFSLAVLPAVFVLFWRYTTVPSTCDFFFSPFPSNYPGTRQYNHFPIAGANRTPIFFFFPFCVPGSPIPWLTHSVSLVPPGSLVSPYPGPTRRTSFPRLAPLLSPLSPVPLLWPVRRGPILPPWNPITNSAPSPAPRPSR